jgi:hypothetical protein
MRELSGNRRRRTMGDAVVHLIRAASGRIILEIRELISITNQIFIIMPNYDKYLILLCFQRPSHSEGIQIPFEFEAFF